MRILGSYCAQLLDSLENDFRRTTWFTLTTACSDLRRHVRTYHDWCTCAPMYHLMPQLIVEQGHVYEEVAVGCAAHRVDESKICRLISQLSLSLFLFSSPTVSLHPAQSARITIHKHIHTHAAKTRKCTRARVRLHFYADRISHVSTAFPNLRYDRIDLAKRFPCDDQQRRRENRWTNLADIVIFKKRIFNGESASTLRKMDRVRRHTIVPCTVRRAREATDFQLGHRLSPRPAGRLSRRPSNRLVPCHRHGRLPFTILISFASLALRLLLLFLLLLHSFRRTRAFRAVSRRDGTTV